MLTHILLLLCVILLPTSLCVTYTAVSDLLYGKCDQSKFYFKTLIFMQIPIKFNLYYLVDINLIIQIFILNSSEDQTSEWIRVFWDVC